MRQDPDLLPRTNGGFRGGYGARSIGISQSQSTLFVGCKDGSITAIDLERAIRGEGQAGSRVPMAGEQVRAGVRAIFDCGQGWLLIGDDRCSLSLVGWQEPFLGQVYPVLSFNLSGEPEVFSPITMIERWNGPPNVDEVVVSLRQGDTRVLRLESERGEPGAPFRLVETGRFPRARAVCGIIHDGAVSLLISESGDLWVVDGGGDAVPPSEAGLPDPWKRFERPGLISDVTPMAWGPHSRSGAGAYFSCDEGVFRLRFDYKDSILEVEKESLPGLTGMSMAVSHTVRKEKAFLWVSDLVGDVSLFWRPTTDSGKVLSPWRRLGLRLESSQVIRSIATALKVDGQEVLVIGQACRNDRIVVTWYPEMLPAPAEQAVSELARLLSRGTWQDLERRVMAQDAVREQEGKKEGKEWAGPLRKDWTPEAVLADFFEEAGEHSDDLAYFLANPTTDLGWSVLQKIGTEGSEGRAAEAVLTWTYALIGTIHRRMSRKEQQCLGVIRWLRRLSELCSGSNASWCVEVQSVIESAIQHVRKWGLFGETYYESGEVEIPLEALQNWRNDYRRFDHIVYSSLLFGRRINVEAEFPDSSRGPLTPWDVRYLAVPHNGGLRDLIAVSWHQGTELFERFRLSEDRPAIWRRVWGWADSASREANFGEGFSRKILMGNAPFGDEIRPFLLEAPVKAGNLECLRLWWISSEPGGKVEEAASGGSGDLGDRESVHSFLELGPGLILVGMQVGRDQSDAERKEPLPLVVLRTTPEGGFRLLRCSDPAAQLPLVYPETRTIESQRNPILALARDKDEDVEDGLYKVIAGRGDGQILRITIRIEAGAATFGLSRCERVARLGSPVRALIYQARKAVGRNGQPTRLFAGTADGTLVAFQELEVPGPESGRLQELAFATLWATREEGPIARLHLCEYGLLSEDSRASVVLAVTQKGMAILFLNSSSVGDLEKDWCDHQRIKIPGERLGRFSLGGGVFGSALIEQWNSKESRCLLCGNSIREGSSFCLACGAHRRDSLPPTSQQWPEGQVTRIVVATGEGTLKIMTLHFPKYSSSRKRMFQQVRDAWLSTLRDSQNRVRVPLLRKIESMHVAAPNLPSVFVRWILSSKPTRKGWKERIKELDAAWPSQPARQWIPRHLQALVELDEEWSAGNSLKGRVRAALLSAWQVGDLLLFKEVIQVILRRANEELFQQALQGGDDPRFAEQFREIMQDLDEMKGVWLGGSGEIDTKIRIVFAKSLVDGDTLWSLAAMLGKEEGDLLRDPDTRPRGEDNLVPKFNPFRKAMRARVEQLHRFLAAGDPLLALETLRAANLTILRSARRLIDANSQRRDLHWDSIRGYFEAVGDFAARVAHSGRGDMTEAVTHEICRAYAVGMFACPPRAFRLSSWMCEADLPREFALGVHLQLQLLEQLLGEQVPREPRLLVEAVLGRLLRPESEPGTLLTVEQKEWAKDEGLRDLGQDNRDLIQESAPFDDLLVWLRELASCLSSEASEKGLNEAWKRLDHLKNASKKGEQVIHSRGFWIRALEDLVKDLEEMEFQKGDVQPGEVAEIPSLPTRPDLVLFSRRLRSWCLKQREELHRLKADYAIFDPQYSMYIRTLDLLSEAAAGLPHGSALQKNMVLGVLGHSLLELLDEHLLELWEIAQVLDPKQAWDKDDQETRKTTERHKAPVQSVSRAAEFARDLLSMAHQAELIPKNLRSLQGLLSYPAQSPQNSRSYCLGQLFREFQGVWNNTEEVPDIELESRSYHFLRLTLRELAQNHQDHGLTQQKPQVRWFSAEPPSVQIEFFYDKEQGERLQDVWTESHNLQRPVRPREEPHSKSHGAGLYLANLAAASEGWKLTLNEPGLSPGRLIFRLEKERFA